MSALSHKSNGLARGVSLDIYNHLQIIDNTAIRFQDDKRHAKCDFLSMEYGNQRFEHHWNVKINNI